MDNLQTATAKAVARLMSFAQITCYNLLTTIVFLLLPRAKVLAAGVTRMLQSNLCQVDKTKVY